MGKQNILIIIFVIIIGATVYFWYQTINTAEIVENPAVVELESRLTELRRLKDIRFDTSIFQDKFFQRLSLPVIPPPPEVTIGRPNPFAPF